MPTPTKNSNLPFNGGQIQTVVTLVGMVLVPLWGYFTLQRDTADNKVAITTLTKLVTDGQGVASKQIIDAQTVQAKAMEDISHSITARMDELEKYARGLDANGTSFGKAKIDDRLEQLDDLKRRMDKTDQAFDEMQPKITTIYDHVEQMWGNYLSQNFPDGDSSTKKKK